MPRYSAWSAPSTSCNSSFIIGAMSIADKPSVWSLMSVSTSIYSQSEGKYFIFKNPEKKLGEIPERPMIQVTYFYSWHNSIPWEICLSLLSHVISSISNIIIVIWSGTARTHTHTHASTQSFSFSFWLATCDKFISVYPHIQAFSLPNY